MTNWGLYSYPWDLLDGGLDRRIGEIGDLGIKRVALASSYHAGKIIRPRARHDKVLFLEDGTVYFKPDTAGYGRIKPSVSKIVDDVDIFREWERVGQGIDLTAWTVTLHNTLLGQQHPDCCVENCYGNRYIYSLNPAHPDVRDYVVNLCSDMARYDAISRISLETPGYLPYAHGFHHEFSLMPVTPWIEFLLALDFSPAFESYAQAEQIDLDNIRKRVCRELDIFFETGAAVATDFSTAEQAAIDLDMLEILPYLALRCRLVESLVNRIRSAVSQDTKIWVIASVQMPTALSWLEGSDISGLAKVCDGLEVCSYASDSATIVKNTSIAKNKTGAGTPFGVVIRPCYPDHLSTKGIAETIEKLSNLDLDEISFYNFGLMPQENLDRLQQIINFPVGMVIK